MKNRILILGYFLIYVLYPHISKGQDQDSTIQLPKNTFFKLFLYNKVNELTLIIPDAQKFTTIHNPILKNKQVFLLKNAKGVYLVFDGTSRVYQFVPSVDSIYLFKRMDNVENINYNINAQFFSYNNDIYNYGGYGFWKSNGLLRKFNFKNKEWDIVPLNREIHSGFEWKSYWLAPGENINYIFFEHIVNEGIKQNDEFVNTPRAHTYILDLSRKLVEDKGKLNNLLIQVFPQSTVLHTNEGVLILRTDQSYYLKPKENIFYQIEDASMVQSLGRLNWNTLYFVSENKFYFWNFEKNLIDVIDISNIKLSAIGKIWMKDLTTYYYVIGLLSLIFFLGLFIKYKIKRTSFKIKTDSTVVEKGTVIQVPLLSETEISLIKLLIEKTAEDKFATSNEINYIIGCKDKNVGLQKKMRSDIINSINSKYKAFSKTDQNLVESKRTEFDKRFFHYHIPTDQLEKAKVFIELTAV